MILLWVILPMVGGWHPFPPEDSFLSKARLDVDHFHHALFQTDSSPLDSHHVQKKVFSTSGAEGGGGHGSSGGKTSKGMTSDTGKAISHHQEGGQKGHSDKENVDKKYGEELKKKGGTFSEGGYGGEHHSGYKGEQGEGYKDKLLHKQGNYEKGYRDKYHLDESLKHDKFWSSHHSLDQYHKYGHQDSEFHKKHADKYKHQNEKHGGVSASGGKKGETSGGHSGSEHQGHKSGAGSESKYEHKTEYEKKKDQR